MAVFPKAALATGFFPLESFDMNYPAMLDHLSPQRRRNSMISVHLGEDLERFIRDAVRSGRYANEDDVMSDALVRLRNTMNKGIDTSDKETDSSGPGKKLTKQEFHRHLVKIGLLDRPPETDADDGKFSRLDR